MSDELSSSARRPVGVAVISAAAFFLLFAIHWALGDRFQAYRYTMSDAMYYYVVGMNWVDHGVLGFDQELPSNGFHPLWQVLIAAFYGVAQLTTNPAWSLIVISIGAGLIMATGAMYFIVAETAREFPRMAFLLPLLPFGVYTLLAYRFVGTRALLWSQVNGLESALSLLLFALFIREFLRNGLGRWRVCAAWLALMILSRLDTVFILPAMALLVINGRDSRKPLLRIYGVLSIVIILYMAINQFYCGALMPVSGAVKSSFPHLRGQIAECIAQLIGDGLRPHAHRAAGILLPLLASIALIPFYATRIFRHPDASRWDALNLVLLAFVIIRHLHDLLFVAFIHVGEWYYPISQIIITLATLGILERAAAKFGLVPTRGKIFAIVMALVVSIEGVFFFRMFSPMWRHNDDDLRVLNSAGAVRAFYGATQPKLLCIDDGQIAFSFRYPSLAGIGLNLDVASARALWNGTLLDHALSRGFDRVACFQYQATGRLTNPLTPAGEIYVRRWMRDWKLEVGNRRIRVEYLPDDKSFAIFRILPPADAPGNAIPDSG